MKKVLTLLLCMIVVISAFAMTFSVSAATAKSVVAYKGTPTIDGEEEEIWATANEVEVNTLTTNIYPNSDTSTYATVKILWDEQYVYYFAKVYDSAVFTSATKGKEDCDIDGLDFQISEGNLESKDDMRSEDGNGNFNVAVNGALTGWGYAFEDGVDLFYGVANETDYGYSIEARIPFTSITPSIGTVISAELQINDNLNGEGRGAIIVWNASQCLGHANSSDHGKIELAPPYGEEAPEPVTEEDTTEKATEPTKEDNKDTEADTEAAADTEKVTEKPTAGDKAEEAQVDWVWLIGAGVVVVAVVVFIIVKKKK